MNTANKIVYFCDACKKAYRASRANNAGLIVSVLKGLAAFFCGFSVQVVEDVPARVSGENDRGNSIITHQVPDKNILTERNITQESILSLQADLNENEKIVDDRKSADRHEDENLSGACNNDAMPESDQVIARKVLKKWKGYQRRSHPHLMPLLSHQKRIRAMTLAKKIESRKKRPWGKELEGGSHANKPYCDHKFGLVIKPGAYSGQIFPTRTDNVKHAVMLSNIITGRGLIHLYVPARDFFKIEDFGLERRPPENRFIINDAAVETVVIEEYVKNTLNVNAVPGLYSQNPERFAGVASDMARLVHAGVYMSDLIQRPYEKQYRTFIVDGFESGRTVDDLIQERLVSAEKKLLEEGVKCEDMQIDLLMDIWIRYDNLLFRDVGKDQLQGVLVDIDDVQDANKLSVEDQYLDLFIMFYDNYDAIIDTIERLGVTLSHRQKQLFRFASDLSRQMMHRMQEKRRSSVSPEPAWKAFA